MRCIIILISIVLLSLTGCEAPSSLEAVAGIDGVIRFDSVWPDSLIAATVVVFDLDLELDSLNISGYPVADHFITYSDPINPGVVSATYFISWSLVAICSW